MIVRELINLIGFKVNESQMRQAEARVNTLKNKMRTFGTQATLLLTAPFVGLNIWLAKTLSGFEQMDVAFETMIGSAEEADKLIQDMLNFAAKTPFEIQNIGGVVKQLLAVGIETDKVIPTLKALGDTAAGLSVPIQRLALNYGQIKTQTKLTGRELRDFAVAGVPLLDELSKMLNKSTSEIRDMVSRGEIGFKEVEQAFINMTSEGGRFANLMIKQSATLGGMWSNFKDLVVLSARDFSKELLPVFKSIVLFMIRILEAFKSLTPTMKRTLFALAALLAVIGPLTLAFVGLVKVGLAIQSVLLAITGAAKLTTVTTLLALGKFALIGIALAAALGLALVLFEDIFRFMNGQSSLLGLLVGKLGEYNEKLKEMGIFFLDNFKKVLQDISRAFDGFIEFTIGIFTGRWKFALDGLIKLFINTMKAIGDVILIPFQAIADLKNKIFGGKKISIKEQFMQDLNTVNKFFQERFPQVTQQGRIIERAAQTVGIPRTGATLNQFTVSPEVNVNLTGTDLTTETVTQVSNSVASAVDEAMKRATRDLINAMPEDE